MIVRYFSLLTLVVCLSLITGFWALEGTKDYMVLGFALLLFLAGWIIRGVLERLSNEYDDPQNDHPDGTSNPPKP